MDTDSKPFDSEASLAASQNRTPMAAWLKVGVVAAASALAGGLAAAFFYRKTLTHLRNAEPDNSNFGILDRGTDDEG
jgi:hypothetical protein